MFGADNLPVNFSAVKHNFLSCENLKEVDHHEEKFDENFVPIMGHHFVSEGPHLTVFVAGEGTFLGAELIVPVEEGWFPWYDQVEGDFEEYPELGEAYTQTVWIADPAMIE